MTEDRYALIRAHHEARDRKNREIERTERILKMDRESMRTECQRLGLPHDGLDDEALRRLLLAAREPT